MDPVAFLHPQKLYKMLRACPTPKSRARAAFEFLRGTSGADTGFLFLSYDDGLTLAASAREAPAPAGMHDAIRDTWQRRREAPPDDDMRTLDVAEIRAAQASDEDASWTSADGDSYERRVLGTYREGRYLALGVAVLKRNPGRALAPVRHMHLEALCAALLDSGDIARSE